MSKPGPWPCMECNFGETNFVHIKTDDTLIVWQEATCLKIDLVALIYNKLHETSVQFVPRTLRYVITHKSYI